MINTTLEKIEAKIRTAPAITEDNRTELLHLLNTLQIEVEELSKTEREGAESITGFTQISAHEATRQERNRDLLQLSLKGLATSVQDFETSHPSLADTVNSICQVLSNMGI
jgi:hypothetical protein